MCWEETWVCIWIRGRRLCGHAIRCSATRIGRRCWIPLLLFFLFTAVSTTRCRGEYGRLQMTIRELNSGWQLGISISRAVTDRSVPGLLTVGFTHVLRSIATWEQPTQ